MHLEVCYVGSLQTNCYMLANDDTCIIVDPGDEPTKIKAMLKGRDVDGILVTHFHHDHIGALLDMVRFSGAPVYASRIDAPNIVNMDPPPFLMLKDYGRAEKVDVELEDGQVFKIGSIELRAILTPGHTRGGMCFYDEADGILFSGDTLFRGVHGRTDFPGGDDAQMASSLKRLAELPAETSVLSGHGEPSTIGAERTWIERL